MTRQVFCQKHQQQADGLNEPPIPGEVGQRIFENISAQAWDEWINHQTMIINEYRLNLMDPKARIFIREEMEKFLFGEGATKPSGYTPEASDD